MRRRGSAHVSVSVEQHILELEIAVQDVLPVEVLEGEQQLRRDVQEAWAKTLTGMGPKIFIYISVSAGF